MTEREYDEEVASIAKSAVEEHPDDEDAQVEYVEQSVDGHQWIIYTHYCPSVLEHSDNQDALFDNMGATEFDSYSDAIAKMAYEAMRADVLAELDNAREEAAQEEEDELEPVGPTRYFP